MIRLLKTTILSTAALATVFAAVPAEARDRYGRDWPRHHQMRADRGPSDGHMIAAGVIGLALGAIVVGALAQPEPKGPVYRGEVLDDPAYFPPAPVAYDGGFEPWSPDWYAYCEVRYRSFNPDTGTFVGYDGRRHFCVAG